MIKGWFFKKNYSFLNLKNVLHLVEIAGSSNGRTSASGAEYLGSSPSPAARKIKTLKRQL